MSKVKLSRTVLIWAGAYIYVKSPTKGQLPTPKILIKILKVELDYFRESTTLRINGIWALVYITAMLSLMTK